jgi:predicted metal-dependent phosphoesterase TrpH
VVAVSSVLFPKSAAAQQSPSTPKALAKLPPPDNPFQKEGNWYKAALHVHTKTSDGDVDVPARLAQYRSAGFHVVAVTDHWKTNDLSAYSDGSFLAINSMEAHPLTGTGAPAHHFVCLALPHPFELSKELPAQQLIDTVRRAGGKVVYAHPYWTAHSIEEMQEVNGYVAVEVYNGHCDLASAKGYSQVHVDQMLNKGLFVGLTAVDDIHKSAWIGQGWTMIRAKGLTKADIMEALGKGCFYASCGPTIEDYRIENGMVSLKASPVTRIRFFFNGAGGGRLFQAESGKALTEARWKFVSGRKPAQWVRAEVVDKDGKYAWTNPLPTTKQA